MLPILPNNEDTQEILPYDDQMQQRANAAFTRLNQMVNLAPNTDVRDWLLKQDFWVDLLSVLEYAILK